MCLLKGTSVLLLDDLSCNTDSKGVPSLVSKVFHISFSPRSSCSIQLSPEQSSASSGRNSTYSLEAERRLWVPIHLFHSLTPTDGWTTPPCSYHFFSSLCYHWLVLRRPFAGCNPWQGLAVRGVMRCVNWTILSCHFFMTSSNALPPHNKSFSKC